MVIFAVCLHCDLCATAAAAAAATPACWYSAMSVYACVYDDIYISLACILRTFHLAFHLSVHGHGIGPALFLFHFDLCASVSVYVLVLCMFKIHKNWTYFHPLHSYITFDTLLFHAIPFALFDRVCARVCACVTYRLNNEPKCFTRYTFSSPFSMIFAIR